MTALALNVELNRTVRAVRTRLLRQAGFAVHEAASGQEALALASEDSPHLILLSVVLPDASGFEICRRLKLDAELCGTPVICISERFGSEELAASRRCGADAYLTEPLDVAALLETIRRLVDELRNAAERRDELTVKLLARMDALQRTRKRLLDNVEMLQDLLDLPTGLPGVRRAAS